MIRSSAIIATLVAVSFSVGGCLSDTSMARSQDGHVHDHDGGHDHHHDDDAAHSHAHHDDGDAVEVGHAALHPASDPKAACVCGAAMAQHGWCPRCNVGYIAGHRVESAVLFETLDPHGHEMNLDRLTCRSCRAAVAADGFCDGCGMGFRNGLAYFTRLTHGLAAGRTINADDIACERCAAGPEPGWCDGCGRGVIGNVALNDRGVFSATAEEYRTLLAAIDHVPTCELCACAMVVHRECPRCGISYERTPEPSDRGRSPAGVQ